MSRSAVLSLVLAMLGGAAVAHAGTVYVPAPGVSTLGGSTYEVQISVSNTAIAAREAKQLLLANDSDGTLRTGTPTTVTVQPGRTAVVKATPTFRGLVELSGGGELRYTARLVGTGPGRMGVHLPVITSDNMIKAGQAIALQGLLSGSGRTTSITLVNLAHQAAQCTASVTRADGTAVGNPSTTIPMKALSQVFVSDVFAGGPATEVRATIFCNKEFFAYALISDAATGELTYIGPSGSGESLLRLPGEAPGCPVTAACFDVKGVVHAPTTPANAVKRVVFNPVPGTYKKIRLTMDVTAGPWSTNPAALHMLFWLVKDKNFNMFGYASFRGPDTNQALLRHGIGLTHPNKIKVVQPITIVAGKNYHLDYTYDTTTSIVDLAISETGTSNVTHLTSTPNVGSFSFGATEKLVIDMGFSGANPDEGPTFGWTYRDLHVELYK